MRSELYSVTQLEQHALTLARACQIGASRKHTPDRLLARLGENEIALREAHTLLPQAVLTEGGYRVHGRTDAGAEKVLDDARAIAEAGAFAVVLEGVTTALGKRITEELPIPTIGIGGGPHCDGQIQVLHDLLGLFEQFVPKHAKRYAELAGVVRDAVSAYGAEVRGGQFPDGEHSFE